MHTTNLKEDKTKLNWMVATTWEQGVGKVTNWGESVSSYHLHFSFWTRVVLLIRKFQPLEDCYHFAPWCIWYLYLYLIDSSPQPISRYDLPGPSRPGREYTPLRELLDEGAKFEWRGGLSVFGGPRPCLQCCQLPATFGIWWRQYEGKDTVSPVPILVWSLGIKQESL